MTKTNFEKIKEMSIEELINFFYNHIDCEICPAQIRNCCNAVISCKKSLKQWLESECKK